jgi:hypothetical protein
MPMDSLTIYLYIYAYIKHIYAKYISPSHQRTESENRNLINFLKLCAEASVSYLSQTVEEDERFEEAHADSQQPGRIN